MVNFKLALFLFPLAVFADFSFEGHLSSPKIPLTENATLELTLHYPDTYHVNVPVMRARLMQFGIPGLSPFRLIGEKIGTPKKNSDGDLQQTLSFTLEPQIPGNYHLTFLSIPFEPNKEAPGELVELLSPIYTIQIEEPVPIAYPIESLMAPLLKLDLKPSPDLNSANRLALKNNPERIQEEERRNVRKQEERQIPWFALLALLCAVILLFIPRKKKEAPTPSAEPRQTALERLAEIQQQQSDADTLYTELTSTVRDYLENVYQVKARTQTTEEFLKAMAKHPLFDEETRKDLMDFMQMADEVKFGRYQPTESELEAAISATKKILKT